MDGDIMLKKILLAIVFFYGYILTCKDEEIMFIV